MSLERRLGTTYSPYNQIALGVSKFRFEFNTVRENPSEEGGLFYADGWEKGEIV